MKVYKRNGAEQDFCLDKIKNAIKKADASVPAENRLTEEQFAKVVATVEKFLEPFDTVKVEDIQDLVEKALMKHNRYEIAKAYILFRNQKKQAKVFDDVDEQVLAITKGESAELRGDNANKHIDVNSSIRDYIAGTECKSLAQKILPKEITNAHKKGYIHYHDMDYSPIMPLHNCDVFNIEDMLDNGFMMNDTKITSPRRFSTASNLAAQCNLIISGSQYGGQTFSWAHLAKYVQSTRNDCARVLAENLLSLEEDSIFTKIKKFFRRKHD
jgi:ribonucleoside-triphosphate reductase (formate)